MSKKFFLTVTGASIVIIFFGILNKGLGMIREVIFAHRFGLRQSYELYLLAVVIPTVINTFILYVGQNFFIPRYNKIKAETGETDARIFFNKALALFFFLSLLVTALIFVFMEPLLTLFVGEISASDFLLTKNILKFILLTIPLNGIISIISAYLQAEFDFKNAYFSQLFLNLSVIIVVLSLKGMMSIYSIPIGFLLGNLLQTGYLLFIVRTKIKLHDLTHGKSNFLRDFPGGIFMATVIIELLGQLYVFIDRLFYQSVPHGGIAALNYATTVYLIPLSILSMAFSSAIFPKFSEAYSKGNLLETEKLFYTSMRITFFCFIPLTFVFIFFSQPIIELFYKRGAFSAKDAIMTAEVLMIYGVSLVFFAAYTIVNKLIFGIAELRWLLIASITVISVKIISNLLLIETLQQNGLALASSLSFFCYFVFGLIIVVRKLKLKTTNLLVNAFSLYATGAFISYLLLELLFKYLFFTTILNPFVKMTFFFFVYLFTLWIIQDELIPTLKNLITKVWSFIFLKWEIKN